MVYNFSLVIFTEFEKVRKIKDRNVCLNIKGGSRQL